MTSHISKYLYVPKTAGGNKLCILQINFIGSLRRWNKIERYTEFHFDVYVNVTKLQKKDYLRSFTSSHFLCLANHQILEPNILCNSFSLFSNIIVYTKTKRKIGEQWDVCETGLRPCSIFLHLYDGIELIFFFFFQERSMAVSTRPEQINELWQFWSMGLLKNRDHLHSRPPGRKKTPSSSTTTL